jgi:hypothetical protein
MDCREQWGNPRLCQQQLRRARSAAGKMESRGNTKDAGLDIQSSRAGAIMKQIVVLAVFIIVGLGALPGDAANNEPIKFGEDRFKLSAGGFFTGLSSEMTLDVTANEENKTINIEDDLGLKSTTNTFRVDGYWRPGSRHRINIGYYSLDRSGKTELLSDVEWEDVVFPDGVDVDSRINLDVIPISYAYSFLKREKWEIAASIGFHWMKIDTGIAGEAFAEGDDTLSFVEEEAEVSGPFPLVGLHVDFQPASKWQMGASFQYLELSISKYRGRLLDFRAYVEYYIWRNAGIGVAYNFFDLRAGVTGEDFDGLFNIEYDGWIAYLTTKF